MHQHLMGSRCPVEVWLKDRAEVEKGWCDKLVEEGVSCQHISICMEDMVPLYHPYHYIDVPMVFSSLKN